MATIKRKPAKKPAKKITRKFRKRKFDGGGGIGPRPRRKKAMQRKAAK